MLKSNIHTKVFVGPQSIHRADGIEIVPPFWPNKIQLEFVLYG